MGALLNHWVLGFSAAIGFLVIFPFTVQSKMLLPKILAASGLAFLFLPESLPGDGISAEFVMSCFARFSLGLLASLPVVLVVSATRFGMQLVDSARGQSFASFFDPQTQEQSSALLFLVHYALLASLWKSGAILGSVEELGLALKLQPEGIGLAGAAEASLLLLFHSLTEALWAVSPLLALFVFLDVAIGFVSRQIPRAVITNEAMTVKLLLFALLILVLEPESLRDRLMTGYQSSQVSVARVIQ